MAGSRGSAGTLTSAKRQQALEIAKAHKALKPLLKGHGRIVLVEPNLHDPRRPEGAGQALVGIVDYKRGTSHVALVDPAAGQVIGVEELPGQLQLGDEERKEADALAAADERVRGFLAGRKLNPLTRLYFPRAAQSAKVPHRYAIVFARPTRSERRYAIVDLTTRTVVDVLESLAD
jgi:hypothetical protein